MKLTILRKDKDNVLHLQLKTVEWLMERIQKDTKAEDVGRLRRYIADNGDSPLYENQHSVARVYPSVEMEKTENGNLRIVVFNGLVMLHIITLCLCR